MADNDSREQREPGDEAPPLRPSAHVLAFEALYEHDIARHPAIQVLRRLAEEQGASAEVAGAAERLLQGVLAERAELDATIGELAPAWPLVQMSPVDRNILRLGLLELRQAASAVQERAAVNAAVELAKRYGGESTPRFVRGVLGSAAARRRSAKPSGDSDLPGPESRTL